MTASTLRTALDADTPIKAGWLTLPEPMLAATMVAAGFEALVLDLQHGMITPKDAIAIIDAIIGAGGHAVARVPVGSIAGVGLSGVRITPSRGSGGCR